MLNGSGVAIEVELWDVPVALFGSFVAEVPPLWQASIRMLGATALLWLWCVARGVKLDESKAPEEEVLYMLQDLQPANAKQRALHARAIQRLRKALGADCPRDEVLAPAILHFQNTIRRIRMAKAEIGNQEPGVVLQYRRPAPKPTDPHRRGSTRQPALAAAR